jgi:hypothetical protein
VLGGSANTAGGAGACVVPALILPKLAGGFKVASDCRAVSAPAEMSLLQSVVHGRTLFLEKVVGWQCHLAQRSTKCDASGIGKCSRGCRCVRGAGADTSEAGWSLRSGVFLQGCQCTCRGGVLPQFSRGCQSLIFLGDVITDFSSAKVMADLQMYVWLPRISILAQCCSRCDAWGLCKRSWGCRLCV